LNNFVADNPRYFKITGSPVLSDVETRLVLHDKSPRFAQLDERGGVHVSTDGGKGGYIYVPKVKVLASTFEGFQLSEEAIALMERIPSFSVSSLEFLLGSPRPHRESMPTDEKLEEEVEDSETDDFYETSGTSDDEDLEESEDPGCHSADFVCLKGGCSECKKDSPSILRSFLSYSILFARNPFTPDHLIPFQLIPPNRSRVFDGYLRFPREFYSLKASWRGNYDVLARDSKARERFTSIEAFLNDSGSHWVQGGMDWAIFGMSSRDLSFWMGKIKRDDPHLEQILDNEHEILVAIREDLQRATESRRKEIQRHYADRNSLSILELLEYSYRSYSKESWDAFLTTYCNLAGVSQQTAKKPTYQIRMFPKEPKSQELKHFLTALSSKNTKA